MIDLEISPTLAGVTFVAFANAAPDVLTAIVAGTSDSASTVLIPFGSIFGAFLLTATLILSKVISLQSEKILWVSPRDIIIPLGFYIFVMLYIVFVGTVIGKMNLFLAAVPLVTYVIYIVSVMWLETKGNKRNKEIKQNVSGEGEVNLEIENNKESLISQSEGQIREEAKIKELETLQNEEKEKSQNVLEKINNAIETYQTKFFLMILPPFNQNTWQPVQAIISLLISPVILALTQEAPEIFTEFLGPFPVFLLLSLPAIGLLIYALISIARGKVPSHFGIFRMYAFLIAVAAITVVCSVLVNFVELVQLLTGMNTVFLGLTVFAWANTISDYLSITHFARASNVATAISGIFSCQLLNFLLGFGVALMIQSWTSTDGEYEYKIFEFTGDAYDILSDCIVIGVIIMTLIYIIYLIVIVAKQKGYLNSGNGKIIEWYYWAFVIIACGFAVSTDFLNVVQCDE